MNSSNKNNRTCQECGKAFHARQRDINAGFGKFCSKKCAGAARKGVPVKQKIPNTKCAYCGIVFYKKESRRALSLLFFCCRKHKDLGQKLQNNIKDIWPDHYGKEKVYGVFVPRENELLRKDYRITALENNENKCNRCGYDKYPAILHVHHKDHNRSNNEPSNLEILCPRCHVVHHLVNGDNHE